MNVSASLLATKPSLVRCCSAVEPRPWNDRTSGSADLPFHPFGVCTSAVRGLPPAVRSIFCRFAGAGAEQAGDAVVVVVGRSAFFPLLEHATASPVSTTGAISRPIRLTLGGGAVAVTAG